MKDFEVGYSYCKQNYKSMAAAYESPMKYVTFLHVFAEVLRNDSNKLIGSIRIVQ